MPALSRELHDNVAFGPPVASAGRYRRTAIEPPADTPEPHDGAANAHTPRPHPPIEEPEETPEEHAPETEPDSEPDPDSDPRRRPPRPGKAPR